MLSSDVETRLVVDHDDVRALAGCLAGLTDRRFQPIGNHGVVFHESVRRRLVRTWPQGPKPRPALWGEPARSGDLLGTATGGLGFV
jgi:hypothetical protein